MLHSFKGGLGVAQNMVVNGAQHHDGDIRVEPPADVSGDATGTSTVGRAEPCHGEIGEGSARWAFVVAVIIAVPVILYTNRHQWFFLDEWDFLAGRDPHHVGNLLRPHNEHWTTVPIIIYRLLFRVVGLRHYWPYQLPVLAAHLVAAAMLRIIMCRAGVGPWLATAASTLFVFLGSGRSDLAWGFQVTFTGALAFGLVAVVLADHDGPLDRRDALALGFGLLAIMSSGIGVPMVAVVGLAVLMKRGWRLALVHTVPLGIVYLAWYLRYGRRATTGQHPTSSEMTSFARRLVRATIEGLGQHVIVTVLLVLLCFIGAQAIVRAGTVTRFARYSVSIALLGGAAILTGTVAWGRSSVLSPQGAVPDRYIHVLAVCLLPLIAIGADALTRRWRWSFAPVLLVLLAGLPGNVTALTPSGPGVYLLGSPSGLAALAKEAQLLQPPPNLRPDPVFYGGVTAGWLNASRRAGRFPTVGTIPPAQLATARLAFSLVPTGAASDRRCQPVPPRRPVRLDREDVLVIGHLVASDQPLSGQDLLAGGRRVNLDEIVGGLPVAQVSHLVSVGTASTRASPTGRGNTLRLRSLRPFTVAVAATTPVESLRVCR